LLGAPIARRMNLRHVVCRGSTSIGPISRLVHWVETSKRGCGKLLLSSPPAAVVVPPRAVRRLTMAPRAAVRTYSSAGRTLAQMDATLKQTPEVRGDL
jgi:hypothetical protein